MREKVMALTHEYVIASSTPLVTESISLLPTEDLDESVRPVSPTVETKVENPVSVLQNTAERGVMLVKCFKANSEGTVHEGKPVDKACGLFSHPKVYNAFSPFSCSYFSKESFQLS